MVVTLLVLCWVLGTGCGQNDPAWFQNITTNLFNSSGDILIGGLFPINELTSNLSQRLKPDSVVCDRVSRFGLGMALVMKFAVDEINANGKLMPGIRLGYELFDTCSQAAVIVKPTLYLLTQGSSGELAVMCNYTEYVTRSVAVIGPFTSEMALVIGQLLGFFLMPLVSYGATSDMFSDMNLFPSFLRTVPTDKRQVEAMVNLLTYFQWNWVAVVASDDEYGSNGQTQFYSLATDRQICVAYKGTIPVYSDPEPVVIDMLDNIIDNNVEVVVVFSLSQPAKAFFTEVIKRKVKAVWLASDDWALQPDVSSLPDIQTVGTIIGFTAQNQNLTLLTPYMRVLLSRIREEALNRPAAGPKTDPALMMAQCPECWNLSPDNMSLVTEPRVQMTAFSIYAAIYSVAHALHKLLMCDANSCQRDIRSPIYPWQAPESTCSFECQPGQVRRVKGFDSCCYDCIDCLPGTFQNNTTDCFEFERRSSPVHVSASTFVRLLFLQVDIQCTRCVEGQWSLVRSTNCAKPTFDFLNWDQPETLGLLLAMVLLLSCQTAVGVLLLHHWGSPLVRASGGPMGGVALLGLMGGCACLLLFLGQPGDVVCRLQLPLTSIFHTISLSTILGISLQIMYMTEFRENAPSHVETLRGPGGWLLVLACSGVQAGLCGYYIQQGPSLSQYLARMDVTFVTLFLQCPVDPMLGLGLMQGFNVLLALVSFMCTFMAMRPLRQYNLARDITFASLTYCMVWGVFIPIYIGLDVKDRTIVQVSVSLLSNLGLVASYYMPKCYLLLKRPELNKTEHFCTFLEGAPVIPVTEQGDTVDREQSRK
ncbi:hypothetical protein DPEC_G00211470 [Dallia pectoralis]|uniref:Uncharacterized protein n=1 Tax=Dallia pectoralis TaxID=75939 RepID=A0ACC2G623_DALPE|nr:hypothetical protein DPEC_G00211470 [Dallia pectoralis]